MRIDRSVALPDRCVACNAEAEGYRLKRKLYYSPAAWRIGASLAPFLVLLAGVWLDVPLLAMAFWPLVLVLVIANYFVRKSLKIDFGVCKRHRDLRTTLITLSFVCVGGVVLGILLGIFSLGKGGATAMVLLGSLAGMVVLGMLQSYVGVQAVKLSGIDAQYVWLSGTGAAFRDEFPDLN